ncbi:MAG: VOC family protein [Egibacteraceae bacterium]
MRQPLLTAVGALARDGGDDTGDLVGIEHEPDRHLVVVPIAGRPPTLGAVQVLASRVLLAPARFERSIAFYEDALGLVRFREWGQSPHRGIVYFLGGGYLELHESGGGAAPHGVRLWLQVPDVKAACAELAACGVMIDAPPERKPWGLIEMELRDPDGLQLVIVEIPLDHPLRRRCSGS